MTLAFGFGQGLRRDIAPVPPNSFVTGDKFSAPLKLVPHDARFQLGQGLRRDTLTLTSFGQCLKRVMVNKIRTMTAKHVPYLPCLTALTGRLAPHDARFQLGQGLRRDNFPARTTEVVQSGWLAKVPSRVLGIGTARCLRPDAPDAAVRIFDSVRAGRVTCQPCNLAL